MLLPLQSYNFSYMVLHLKTSIFLQVLLHTMNKYMLKVLIIPSEKAMEVTTIPLPLTTFIAVSAYQSMAVTQMKIDNNPFAKAFKYQDNKALGIPKTLLQAMPPALALAQSGHASKNSAAATAVPANKVVAPVLAPPRVVTVPNGQPRPQHFPIIGKE